MKTITKIEPSAVRTTAAKPRVAAYCRVSTKNEEQLLSLEAQKTHYEEKSTTIRNGNLRAFIMTRGFPALKRKSVQLCFV